MSQKPTWAFMVPWEISTLGGVNQVILRLMEQCRQAGHYDPLLLESHYNFPRPAIDTHLGFTRMRVRIPAPICDGKLVGSVARWMSVWRNIPGQLRDIAERYSIRVVNAHFTDLSAWPWVRVARRARPPLKVMLSFHGSDIRKQFQAGTLERRLFRRLLRSADHVVACSRGLLEEIQMLEPAARGAAVVHNGVNLPEQNDPEPAVRRSGSGPVIVTVGRFEYRKGHDLLLKAFGDVVKRHAAAELWLIGGPGEELDATKRRIEAGGLTDRVKFLIAIPQAQVAPTIQQADVFVMSSRWEKGKLGEGLPLAILEAGGLGMPVVSTRCCGADEVIEDGRSGLLTPLEDPCSLSAAILKMLASPQAAREMGAALRRRALDEFTWERAWSAYEALA
ncbi:MAG: glycosyltransferase family 4 protein [Bryobacterales bacterium]|nr:glycosyltransferase family 4 protein [Bryobacterales bacterium]